MATLQYDRGNIGYLRDEPMEPHVEEKQSEPQSGMARMISKLTHQAHMTRDQIIKMAWVIGESREVNSKGLGASKL